MITLRSLHAGSSSYPSETCDTRKPAALIIADPGLKRLTTVDEVASPMEGPGCCDELQDPTQQQQQDQAQKQQKQQELQGPQKSVKSVSFSHTAVHPPPSQLTPAAELIHAKPHASPSRLDSVFASPVVGSLESFTAPQSPKSQQQKQQLHPHQSVRSNFSLGHKQSSSSSLKSSFWALPMPPLQRVQQIVRNLFQLPLPPAEKLNPRRPQQGAQASANSTLYTLPSKPLQQFKQLVGLRPQPKRYNFTSATPLHVPAVPSMPLSGELLDLSSLVYTNKCVGVA